MSNVKNILLVGVGGQGTILASKILSDGLMEAGYDVKMSEIHGMSQRGGNVSTQVRFGDKVFSPIIGRGEADLIVAFEKMEATALDRVSETGREDCDQRCGDPFGSHPNGACKLSGGYHRGAFAESYYICI